MFQFSLAACAAILLSITLPEGAARADAPQADPVPIQQTADQAGITTEELHSVAAALESDPDADWDRERTSELRFRRVSLAGGNNDAVMVRSVSPRDCGGTGNCPLWIFRTADRHLQLVLPASWAEWAGLLPQRQANLRDVILSTHQSAEAGELLVYSFDGRIYRRKKCYWERTVSGGQKRSTEVSCSHSKR
jgi:hypothetical protein